MKINIRERKKPWMATKRGRNTRKRVDGKPDTGFATHSAPKGFYSSSEWQATREAVLTRDPLCVWCFYFGRATEATDADHIIPLNRCYDLGVNPIDPTNIVGSCRSCNSRRASYEAKGYLFHTEKEWGEFLRKKHLEKKDRTK